MPLMCVCVAAVLTEKEEEEGEENGEEEEAEKVEEKKNEKVDRYKMFIIVLCDAVRCRK
jgi:hypothetical protein